MARTCYIHGDAGGADAWDDEKAYEVGEFASDGGVTYYCILGNTDEQPPNATYWVVVFTTPALWEAQINRETYGEETGVCVEDAVYTGKVVFDHAENSGDASLQIILTASGDGVHDGTLGGTGAEILATPNKAVEITTSACLVEKVRLSNGHASAAAVATGSAEIGLIFRNCVFHTPAVGSNAGLIMYGPGADCEVHANLFFRCAFSADPTATLRAGHNSVFNAPGVGFQGDSDVLATRNMVLNSGGNAFNGTFHASSDGNISTDTTANLVNASTVSWDTGVAAHALWESPDEGDLRLTASRQWPDDVINGQAFNSITDLTEVGWDSVDADITVSADAALRGSMGIQSNLDSANARVGNFVWPSAPDDSYFFSQIRLRAGLSMTSGDEWYYGQIMTAAGAAIASINISYDGSNHRVRLYSSVLSGYTGYVNLTGGVGAVHNILIRHVKAGSGGTYLWVAEDGAAFSGAADAEQTGSTDGTAAAGKFRFRHWSLDRTYNSYFDYDHQIIGTSKFNGPDDATGVYGDTFEETLNALGGDTYSGAGSPPSGTSYFPATDAFGNAWGSYHTGAEDYSLGPEEGVELEGTATGTGSATGALDVAKALAGTATGAGSGTGDLERAVTLAGTATGAGGGAGDLGVAKTLAGTATGAGAGTGDLERAVSLAGTATGTGGGSGDLSTSGDIALAGTATGTGSASGDIDVARALAGTATGTGAATGDLLRSVAVAGTATGTGSGTGDLGRSVSLAGTATGTGSATGALSGVTTVTGPLSVPMSSLRTLIATTSEFQTWTSTGDVAAAEARIYLAGADSVTRPFAVISHGPMWRMERIAGGARDWFVNRGSLRVLFEAAVDAGDLDSHEDAETAFLNDVGGVMTAALELSGTSAHISLDGAELDFGPVRSDEDEGENYYQARFAVTWGPA